MRGIVRRTVRNDFEWCRKQTRVFFFLCAVAIANLAVGFGLAVFLHHAPDLDSETLQSPVLITPRNSTGGKSRFPSIQFRSPFSSFASSALDIPEASSDADQAVDSDEAPEEDSLMGARRIIQSPNADNMVGIPLVQLVRAIALDLQAFSDAVSQADVQGRMAGAADPRGMKGESLASFWQQTLDLAKRQLDVADSLHHIPEVTDVAREVALDLSDYVYDWAAEMTQTAYHYLTPNMRRCKIAVRQICFDLQRLAGMAFALTDHLDTQRCRLPLDPKCPLTNRLTGLDNRVALERIFVDFKQRAAKNSQDFCAAMVDIDRFHLVNSRWGLRLADVILREIAQSLLNAMPTYFGTGRFIQVSHSTFLVLLDQPLQDTVTDAIESLRQSVEATTLQLPGDEYSLTISCGVVSAKADSVPELLEHLRQSLGHSKRQGRNRTSVTDPNGIRLIEPTVRDVQGDTLRVTASTAL